ncbi:MAG: hypothetical protein WCD83_20670 [Pseudolabrys sp.]
MTAPFNRDLELTAAEADGSRTMAFLRMLLQSQLDNCFLLCGMRNSGAARQSSNNIKLLLSGSRGITMR